MLHDYAFFLLGAVLSVTISAALLAVVMVFRSAPSTPFSRRLFDILIGIITAGFFTLLGLLHMALGHG